MPTRAFRIGVTTLAFGASGILGAVWTADRAPALEDKIERRVETELLRNDLRHLNVEVDGRDVHLHGFANGDDQVKAQRVLESITGIDDHSYDISDVRSGRALATITSTGIVIESNTTADQAALIDRVLASESLTQVLLETAPADAAPRTIEHSAVVGPEIELDPELVPNLRDVLSQTAGDLAEADILVTERLVTIRGVAHDEQALARIEEYATSASQNGLVIETELAAAALSLDAEVVALVNEFDALAAEIRRAGIPLFDSDADTLTPKGREVGDRVVAAMDRYQLPLVETIGHTDSVGQDDYNLDLSTRRSASLMAYVISTGIAPERMWSNGAGETRPIGDNETDLGRQANRRVEFAVHRTRAVDTSTPSTPLQDAPSLEDALAAQELETASPATDGDDE